MSGGELRGRGRDHAGPVARVAAGIGDRREGHLSDHYGVSGVTSVGDLPDGLGHLAYPASVVPGLGPLQISILPGEPGLAVLVVAAQHALDAGADRGKIRRSGRGAQFEPAPPVVILNDLVADECDKVVPAQRVQPGTEVAGPRWGG